MEGIPIGITASFSNVAANVKTPKFTMPGSMAIVFFNPADVNNAGTLTLFDSSDNVLMTMTVPGHYPWQVPQIDGGAIYYFSSTADISTVAMTIPNGLRG